jgi:hypothetical protein
MKNKYQALLKRAKQKNLDVTLSFSSFKKLKYDDCEYCGISNMFIKFYCEILNINTPWATIDRKDNSKGYTEDNCVSACFLCNKIKGSFFNYEEMKQIGAQFVQPKFKEIEKEAYEAFAEWCEYNVIIDEEYF